MKKNTPKLHPQPILEAVVEVRFEPSVPLDAVFGMLYGSLGQSYPSVKKLPILSLPEEIRQIDPGLKYRPHFRLDDLPEVLQIGPRVIGYSTTSYPGWREFRGRIEQLFESLKGLQFIGSPVRFGLKAVNFFDQNIFSFSKIHLEIGGVRQGDYETTVRTAVQTGSLTTNVTATNRATVNVQSAGSGTGSLLELDTFTVDFDKSKDFKLMDSLIFFDEAHEVSRDLFFQMLSDEFIREHTETR